MKALIVLSTLVAFAALMFFGCSSQQDSGLMSSSNDANAVVGDSTNSSQLTKAPSTTDTSQCSRMHNSSTSMMSGSNSMMGSGSSSMMSGGMMGSTTDTSMMRNHDSTQCQSHHK